MRLARRFNKWIARAGGFFWLPCPICGDHFGGHELHHSKSIQVLLDDGYSQRCVCYKPDCIYEAGAMSVKSGQAGMIGYQDLSSGPKYREYGDLS